MSELKKLGEIAPENQGGRGGGVVVKDWFHYVHLKVSTGRSERTQQKQIETSYAYFFLKIELYHYSFNYLKYTGQIDTMNYKLAKLAFDTGGYYKGFLMHPDIPKVTLNTAS